MFNNLRICYLLWVACRLQSALAGINQGAADVDLLRYVQVHFRAECLRRRYASVPFANLNLIARPVRIYRFIVSNINGVIGHSVCAKLSRADKRRAFGWVSFQPSKKPGVRYLMHSKE